VDLYPEDWEPSADDAHRGIGRSHLAAMIAVTLGLIVLLILAAYAVTQFVPLILRMIPIPLDF
jgi:hypothetical protein